MIGAESKPNPFHEVWTDRLLGWLGDLDTYGIMFLVLELSFRRMLEDVQKVRLVA